MSKKNNEAVIATETLARMNETPAQRLDRILKAERRYVAANKSDPFAAARCKTHREIGISSIDGDKDNYYDAEMYLETRVLPPDGRDVKERTYQVESYRNIVHP